MADVTSLDVTVRKEFGKGASRRARRAGLIPAVIYSASTEPVHVDLPGHETFLIVKDNANALINLKFDGEEQLALVKDVQRHPVRRDMLHIDLLAVKRGEKVEVEIPLTLTGESEPGTVVNQEYYTILVSAPATAIPEGFELSIDGLDEGDIVYASALTLPANVTTDLEDETILASIVVPEEIPETPETDEEGEETEDEGNEAGDAEGDADAEADE